jgi:hypothetical protein
MTDREEVITHYVREHVRFAPGLRLVDRKADTIARFEQAFSLLPEKVLDLFLSGARKLSVTLNPDPGLPIGMVTGSHGPADKRSYSITVYDEQQDWPRDQFTGAFLRELGHVVVKRPPESEWPTAQGDRARFRERLECRADAMVWRWGLRHYSMSHLAATYPEHWVERIVEQISRMLLEEDEISK